MEILEIGADGSFDIPQQPPQIVKEEVFIAKGPAKESGAAGRCQLDLLLAQLAVGSYKLMNNENRSVFVLLMRYVLL